MCASIVWPGSHNRLIDRIHNYHFYYLITGIEYTSIHSVEKVLVLRATGKDAVLLSGD